MFGDANWKKIIQIVFKIKDTNSLGWDCWEGAWEKFLAYWCSMHLINLWMYIKLYTSDLSTFLYRCDTSKKYIHSYYKEKQGKDKCKIQNRGYQWEVDGKDWGALWRGFKSKLVFHALNWVVVMLFILYMVYIPIEVLISTYLIKIINFINNI